jgi:hypothetical protein
MRVFLLAVVLALVTSACSGGNSATGPSGQTITNATLKVNVDGATCGSPPLNSPLGPVTIYVDGTSQGTAAPGQGVTDTVQIGAHIISAKAVNFSNAWADTTIQVPVAGFVEVLTCP